MFGSVRQTATTRVKRLHQRESKGQGPAIQGACAGPDRCILFLPAGNIFASCASHHILLILTQTGGAASVAPTPTSATTAQSAGAAGPPSGRSERRLAPAAATSASYRRQGARIQQRERSSGEHDADESSNREEGFGGSGPHAPSCVAATQPLPSTVLTMTLRQHHDNDEPLALHRGGDAGSEGLDADTTAEDEAAAAVAVRLPTLTAPRIAEAIWVNLAGASANTYSAAGDASTAATPPWAAARRDSAEGDEAELPRPLGSDHVALPRLWPHRHAVRRPVTLQRQNRTGRQAGCY